MKKSLLFFWAIFLCLILSSCFSSSSSSKGDEVLDISALGHINVVNVENFSFGGACSGLDGLTLHYSFQTVPGGGGTGEVVKQDSVVCTEGAWEVTGLDVSTWSDGDYQLTVEVEGAESIVQTLHKDLEIPVVTFEAPAARSKEDRISLAGTCSESGTVVYDFLNTDGDSVSSGEALCTYQDDENKSWSVQVDVSGLDDGAMRVDVTLKDKAENPSVVLHHSFVRDTTPPTLTVEESPINSHNQGAYTLSGSCEEEGGEVSVSFHGNVLSGTVLCSGGTWEKTGINAQTIVTSGSEVAVILEHQDDLGNLSRLEKSVVRDVEAPTIVGALGVPSDGTYSSGGLDFSVTYSEGVVVTGAPRLSLTVGSDGLYADYNSSESSGSKVVFRYVILSGHRDSDGIGINTTVGLNGGSVKDGNGNEALLIFTLPSLTGIKVDGNVPSLNRVTGDAGTYRSGDTVSLTATFGQTVSVTGSPRLILGIGGQSGMAEYSDNGNLKRDHTFTYTVGSGETDSDGIEVTGIDLNGGRIQNSSHPPILVPESLGKSFLLPEVKVDNVIPVLTGLGDDAVAKKSKDWQWDCTDSSTPCEYRHAVNTSASHSFQAGDAWGATKAASQSSGTDTYYLHVQAKDSAGNESAVESFSAILDNTGPVQKGDIVVPSSKTYGLGEVLSFELSFDESVEVDTSSGTPRLVLDVGGNAKHAVYTRGSGSATLTFEFTVGSGDQDADGLTGASVLDLNSGSLADQAGNAVLSAGLTGLSVEDLSGVLVNGVPPTLSSVVGTEETYTAGEVVSLTATFSNAVIVSASSGGDSPRLVLDVGGSTRHGTYTGDGALNEGHTFSYTVSAGESDGDGIEVTGLDLQGGSVKNSVGSAVESLGTPLDVSGVLVDTAAPVLTGLSNDAVAKKSKDWQWDCTDSSIPCEYRHVVNTSTSHSFQAGDTWGATKTISQSSGTDTYYLHVQAKDSAGNESAVESFSAILDNTGPVQKGDIVVPPSKTYLLGETLSFELSFDESVVVNTSCRDAPFSLRRGGKHEACGLYEREWKCHAHF